MRPNPGIAWLTAVAVTLPGRTTAAAPACPEGGLTQPPEAALSRKNAALDLRDGGSWAAAARSFRDAADELPACPELDDVRLRWSLWAVEAYEHGDAPAADRRATAEFVDRQLALLEDHPTSRELPDRQRLRAAGERLRPRPAPATTSPAPAGERTARTTPLFLLGLGGAALASSLALVGVFSVRNRRLNAGLFEFYDRFATAGCGLDPAQDVWWSGPATCQALRDERTQMLAAGARNNRLVIAGAVTTALGASLALAGLVMLLRRTPRAGQARVRVTPTLAGLRVEGNF